MEKKRYDGIAIEPVYLDGEEVIVTSGCVTSFDPETQDIWEDTDTINTQDTYFQGMAEWLGIPEGFYKVEDLPFPEELDVK